MVRDIYTRRIKATGNDAAFPLSKAANSWWGRNRVHPVQTSESCGSAADTPENTAVQCLVVPCAPIFMSTG